MKLRNALGLADQIRFCIQIALLPTILAIIKTPSLILHPSAVSRVFMAHVWMLFGPGMDENSAEQKRTVITPNASGVVLDIGAGAYRRCVLSHGRAIHTSLPRH